MLLIVLFTWFAWRQVGQRASDDAVSQQETTRHAGEAIASSQVVCALPYALPYVGFCATFCHEDQFVACGGTLHISLVRVRDGKLERTSKTDSEVIALQFIPATNSLVSAERNGAVTVWDVDTLLARNRLLTKSEIVAPGNEMTTATVSPDGRLLAAGTRDRRLKVWDVGARRLMVDLAHPHGDDVVTGLAFSSSSRTLVSVGWDNRVIVWNIATGERIAQWFCPRPRQKMLDQPDCVAFAPNRPVIATGGTDGSVRIWDLRGTSQGVLPLDRFQKHDDVRAVAFSPDGMLLAAGGAHDRKDASGPLVIWDWQLGREVARPVGHTGPLTMVAFAASQKFLAWGGTDPNVRIMAWPPGNQ
jgi:WD40 repeat protein